MSYTADAQMFVSLFIVTLVWGGFFNTGVKSGAPDEDV